MAGSVIHPDDQLIATNNGTEPVRLMANSRLHVIEPGQKRAVPFEAVRIWFGDPRSGPTERLYEDENGTKSRIPSRSFELKRLNVLYGVEGAVASQKEEADRNKTPYPPPITLADTIPNVTFEDLSGKSIKHVAEDPEGKAASSVVTNYDDPMQVGAELARLKQQVAAMEERHDALSNQPTTDEEAVTEDGPDYSPGK